MDCHEAEVGIRLRKPCSKVLNNLIMRTDTDINIVESWTLVIIITILRIVGCERK